MERVDKLLSSTTNYLSIIKCDTTPKTLPFKCAVYNCTNEFRDFKSHQLATFKFHNFPTNKYILSNWLEVCGLPEGTKTENAKICSDHFTLNDYSRNLKDELLNPGHKRLLKDLAVPSINVRPYSPFGIFQLPASNSENPDNKSTQNGNLNTKKELNQKIYALRKDVEDLQKKIEDRQLAIRHKKISLGSSRKQLKKVAKDLETALTSEIPGSFLSQAQLKLLRGKKKVFWTDDDLAKAFTLRHRGGKELYLYLKHTLNYPLPALSCVQAWAANI